MKRFYLLVISLMLSGVAIGQAEGGSQEINMSPSMTEAPSTPTIPEGSGPDITAGYASVAPTLDGQINPGEWGDALMQDISLLGSPVYMYVKNDANYLYLAFDDQNDGTSSFFDQVGVYFDDEGGTPPTLYDDDFGNVSCPSGEGNFWFGSFGGPGFDDQFRAWINSGGSVCPVIFGGTGSTVAYSTASGNMQYEIMIDITGGSPLVAAPGETLGFRVYTLDNHNGGQLFTGRFPPNSVFNDASTYSNLTLSAGAVPTLGEWGLIILGISCLIFGVVTIRNRKMAVNIG